eukprot:9477595-Pyramimonas_sp.AAC.1
MRPSMCRSILAAPRADKSCPPKILQCIMSLPRPGVGPALRMPPRLLLLLPPRPRQPCSMAFRGTAVDAASRPAGSGSPAAAPAAKSRGARRRGATEEQR